MKALSCDECTAIQSEKKEVQAETAFTLVPAEVPGTGRLGRIRVSKPRRAAAPFDRGLALACQFHDVDPDTGCWIWRGLPTKVGHGQLCIKGTTILAHRYYYERLVGPVPAKAILHHLCGNQLCCNPAHTEITSRSKHQTIHVKQQWAKANGDCLSSASRSCAPNTGSTNSAPTPSQPGARVSPAGVVATTAAPAKVGARA